MKNLNEILDSYKVTELKEFAKNSGVKGYSKLKKAELIDTIISRLANVDVSTLDLPDEIKNSVNDNIQSTAANMVAAIAKDENSVAAADNKEKNITENDKNSDDGVIKLKNRLFGVAPLVANVISEDMPVPPSNTPNSFMQIKKIYPNDKCPCGSGKKYKKCCGKTA